MEQPALILLAFPVIALLVLAWLRCIGKQAAVPLPGFGWLPGGSGSRAFPARAAIVLRSLALLALIPLVAGTTGRAGEEKGGASGALVIVLDNSSSMTAVDFQPFSRLEAAKRSLKSFLTRLPETGIGVVALAGAPQIVTPVTRDRRFVLSALDRIVPASLEDDGTAIGAGTASAVNRLRNGRGAPCRLLLITDGVSNRGNVSSADAADVARIMGVRVDAIGIGTDKTSRFSVPTVDGLQQDVEARIEIDDRALDDLARKTGGSYSRVRNPAELERALTGLEAAYSGPVRPGSRNAEPDWTQILALAVLSLVGAEVILRHFVIREIPQ
jgi:Ca-activated chloride channel family protein